MKDAIAPSKFDQRIAMPIASPSPLVGERITAGRRKRDWVRGFAQHITTLRQPLTRLRLAKPPSPTRGEGKKYAATNFDQRIAMPIATPSPLVGEGITASQCNRGWVRGIGQHITARREPLTRLRFAKPPSPTRGEGKNSATLTRQPA
jgi:hypothetical protein